MRTFAFLPLLLLSAVAVLVPDLVVVVPSGCVGHASCIVVPAAGCFVPWVGGEQKKQQKDACALTEAKSTKKRKNKARNRM